MTRFACPHCRATLQAPDSKAGLTVPCPGCKRPLTVPAPAGVPLPPPPTVPAAGFEVACPGCGRAIAMAAHEDGLRVTCARCGETFEARKPARGPADAIRSPFDPLSAAGPEPDRDAPPARQRRTSGAVGFLCPYCGTDAPPHAREQMSPVGWLVFFLLLTSCAFAWLCWLPFVVMKESKTFCSQCGIKIGG